MCDQADWLARGDDGKGPMSLVDRHHLKTDGVTTGGHQAEMRWDDQARKRGMLSVLWGQGIKASQAEMGTRRDRAKFLKGQGGDVLDVLAELGTWQSRGNANVLGGRLYLEELERSDLDDGRARHLANHLKTRRKLCILHGQMVRGIEMPGA